MAVVDSFTSEIGTEFELKKSDLISIYLVLYSWLVNASVWNHLLTEI